MVTFLFLAPTMHPPFPRRTSQLWQDWIITGNLYFFIFYLLITTPCTDPAFPSGNTPILPHLTGRHRLHTILLLYFNRWILTNTFFIKSKKFQIVYKTICLLFLLNFWTLWEKYINSDVRRIQLHYFPPNTSLWYLLGNFRFSPTEGFFLGTF